MAGKGGGAWKVAYADFVTAMMAFFLVMWITAQNKSVKESVAQYFQNPLGTVPEARATSVHGIEGASADAPLTGEQAGPYGSDSKEIGSEPMSSGGGKEGPGGVEGIPPRPLLHIFEQLDKTRGVGTMVLFADQSAELTQQAKLQLAALLPDLLGKPHKIEVRGHATRNPLPPGSRYTGPWDISFARAVATMDYLVSRGIEADRIRLSQDGAFEPYADDGNELNDSRNARVEVFALGEFTHRFKQTVEERAGGYVPAKEKPVAAAKDASQAKDAGHGKDPGHGGGGGHGGDGAHGGGAAKGTGAAGGKKDEHAAAGAHGAPAAKGGHGH